MRKAYTPTHLKKFSGCPPFQRLQHTFATGTPKEARTAIKAYPHELDEGLIVTLMSTTLEYKQRANIQQIDNHCTKHMGCQWYVLCAQLAYRRNCNKAFRAFVVIAAKKHKQEPNEWVVHQLYHIVATTRSPHTLSSVKYVYKHFKEDALTLLPFYGPRAETTRGNVWAVYYLYQKGAPDLGKLVRYWVNERLLDDKPGMLFKEGRTIPIDKTHAGQTPFSVVLERYIMSVGHEDHFEAYKMERLMDHMLKCWNIQDLYPDNLLLDKQALLAPEHIAERIIEASSGINTRTATGSTAIYDVIKMLARCHPSDPNIKTVKRAIALAIRHGARLDIVDLNGKSPLHYVLDYRVFGTGAGWIRALPMLGTRRHNMLSFIRQLTPGLDTTVQDQDLYPQEVEQGNTFAAFWEERWPRGYALAALVSGTRKPSPQLQAQGITRTYTNEEDTQQDSCALERFVQHSLFDPNLLALIGETHTGHPFRHKWKSNPNPNPAAP